MTGHENVRDDCVRPSGTTCSNFVVDYNYTFILWNPQHHAVLQKFPTCSRVLEPFDLWNLVSLLTSEDVPILQGIFDGLLLWSPNKMPKIYPSCVSAESTMSRAQFTYGTILNLWLFSLASNATEILDSNEDIGGFIQDPKVRETVSWAHKCVDKSFICTYDCNVVTNATGDLRPAKWHHLFQLYGGLQLHLVEEPLSTSSGRASEIPDLLAGPGALNLWNLVSLLCDDNVRSSVKDLPRCPNTSRHTRWTIATKSDQNARSSSIFCHLSSTAMNLLIRLTRSDPFVDCLDTTRLNGRFGG
uniref:Endo/exonuclease/phosphatase domain-containing protein n=1 Tax=Bursaphelenchus xylophilus TaxID=6326 RepID=A0A1I7SE34_BURXY